MSEPPPPGDEGVARQHGIGVDQTDHMDAPPKVGVSDLQASRPVKRSFSIAGHRTSISLEAAFWDAFRELCREDNVSMAAMLAAIDRERGSAAGLSGAVRVWILQRYRGA